MNDGSSICPQALRTHQKFSTSIKSLLWGRSIWVKRSRRPSGETVRFYLNLAVAVLTMWFLSPSGDRGTTLTAADAPLSDFVARGPTARIRRGSAVGSVNARAAKSCPGYMPSLPRRGRWSKSRGPSRK
jgi:hypothetical protein